MNDLPKNDVLKNLKQQFLNGNLVEYDHKYEKTVASWEKSRAAGADAHAVRLGEDCRDLHVFDRIDDISKCHLAYFRDYYESRSTALERMGGAMFYLDTHAACCVPQKRQCRAFEGAQSKGPAYRNAVFR